MMLPLTEQEIDDANIELHKKIFKLLKLGKIRFSEYATVESLNKIIRVGESIGDEEVVKIIKNQN